MNKPKRPRRLSGTVRAIRILQRMLETYNDLGLDPTQRRMIKSAIKALGGAA